MRTLDHKVIMYATLSVSVVLYIAMFIILRTDYDIYESNFFYIHVDSKNTTRNPVVLGVPLKSEAQRSGLAIFFFLNAFLGVLNSVLVDGVFGMMIFEEGEAIIKQLKDEYGGLSGMLILFSIYDMWNSAQDFFTLLGMYSNVIFFMCTTGGALSAGLITKILLLNKQTSRWMKFIPAKLVKAEDGRTNEAVEHETTPLLNESSYSANLTRTLFLRRT